MRLLLEIPGLGWAGLGVEQSSRGHAGWGVGVLLALHACGAQVAEVGRWWKMGRGSRTLTPGQLCRGASPDRDGERSPRESVARRGPEEAKPEVTPYHPAPGRSSGGVIVAGGGRNGENRRIMGGLEVACHGEGGPGLEHSL